MNQIFINSARGIGKTNWLYDEFDKISSQYKRETKTNSIKQVIYNPPATVVMFDDETKVVVKASENDTYDPVFGVLMAYFQKNSGMTKTQVGKFCDGIIEEFGKQQEKKNKKSKKDKVEVDAEDWLIE